MKNFTEKILIWYKNHKRDLPWRHTKDPYKIWLSEIIMQQTQIAQGSSYYIKFLESFPTVYDLAESDEQEILVLWQGLGYYSRARNLHNTAKKIVKKYDGKFPLTYSELIKFKGIGDYTASAISSICYNEKRPAVDGNVLRLTARLFGVREPVNKTSGKNMIKQIVDRLISDEHPGDFNQALMDFGSKVCKPKKPDCLSCIFSEECQAFLNSEVIKLPIKVKPKIKEKLFINYYICLGAHKKSVIIKKRTSGIWKNLYEFPKTENLQTNSSADKFIRDFSIKETVKIYEQSDVLKHVLSHKELFIRFFILGLSDNDYYEVLKGGDYHSAAVKELEGYPFPIIIRKYLDKMFPNV